MTTVTRHIGRDPVILACDGAKITSSGIANCPSYLRISLVSEQAANNYNGYPYMKAYPTNELDIHVGIGECLYAWTTTPFTADYTVVRNDAIGTEIREGIIGIGGNAAPISTKLNEFIVSVNKQTTFALSSSPSDPTSLIFNFDGYQVPFGTNLTLAGNIANLVNLGFDLEINDKVSFTYK